MNAKAAKDMALEEAERYIRSQIQAACREGRMSCAVSNDYLYLKVKHNLRDDGYMLSLIEEGLTKVSWTI